MGSTTAPPSSASSPRESAAQARARFLELVAGLTDPSRRRLAARALAEAAGAEDLVLFVRDEEVDALLPAPGFPQTLPEARRWRALLAAATPGSSRAGRVGYPDAGADRDALATAATDGSVLVLLGGAPRASTAAEIALLLPILAAAFRGERTALVAEGHAAVAREAAGQAKLLAASLDGARQALRRALSEARAAGRAKDQFLAVLSHELRTPLAPVLTTATVLLDDPALPGELRKGLEIIRRNVELEARLIDDLLDLTRIAKGKMALNLDTVDAHASVRQALAICRSDVFAKKLHLTLELAAPAHHVRADPTRLQQVFWNLVKNAVKFTPTGGRLAVRSRAEDGQFVAEVSDSGIGIEPQFLAKIFDAFEQAGESVTRRFGGLGLGLAISRALVQAQGGDLAAASAGLGRGATFSVRLPAVAPPPSSPAADAPAGGVALRKLKLLLVEDHRDTAAVMATLLRRLGHEARIAGTVAAALQAAREQPFDLVLSDLGLPDGSGLDLMRRLRDGHGLAGIAISGYGMEEDVRQTKDAGFIAHLTKPINFEQLKAVLFQVASRTTA